MTSHVERIDLFDRHIVDGTEPEVSEWKGPYPNMRLCLERLRRLDKSPERID
jgi:hypothetical protein